MARIFIASSTFAEYDQAPLHLIKDSGHDYTLNSSGQRLNADELIKQAQGAAVVIAGLEKYDRQVLGQLPQLRSISRCGVGTDTIDLNAAQQRGIKIFNTPDVVVEPVAELTLALILNLLRGVTLQTQLMRQRKWERQLGEQLAGKTVGVIGLGRIGRRVAQLLTRLDAKVVGCDISPDHQWAEANSMRLVGLDELLAEADIVTVHVSPSSGQPFCLKKEHLARLKKGSFLVNVARGEYVEETALVEALKAGHLKAAAVDVFEREPYQGPLCNLPNVILTPHIATFTRQSRVQMEIQAARQAVDFLNSYSEIKT